MQVAARRPGPAPPPPQDGSGAAPAGPAAGWQGGGQEGGEEAGGIPLRRAGGRAGRGLQGAAVGGGRERTWGPASRGSREGSPRWAPSLGSPLRLSERSLLPRVEVRGNYLLNANFGETSDEG